MTNPSSSVLGRLLRGSSIVMILLASVVVAACDADGGDPASDTSSVTDTTMPDTTVHDTTTDGQADSTPPDTVEDTSTDSTVPDGGGDVTPCPGEGALYEPCQDDCDCAEGLACRGYNEAMRWCSTPCEVDIDCGAGTAPCDTPTCDGSIGACRCQCNAIECPEGFCQLDACVQCMDDVDCAGIACDAAVGIDTPRCNKSSGACICGGTCGDGVCDELEEAMGTCPADCPGPCEEGAIKAYACMEGDHVPWCTCTGGVWDCVVDPASSCGKDTSCANHGGSCVATEEECYEGVVGADAEGCAGSTPFCCAPPECTGPGETYYPYIGSCCPGLRALGDVFPMEGGMGGLEGMTCYPGCWALTCAPCGNGTCEPGLHENPCNCPEDCPQSPIQFVCQSEWECGLAHCVQEGTTCTDNAPTCTGGLCGWQTTSHEGAICDPTTRACSSP